METSDVLSLVEDMSGNIDDLEAALAPVLKTAISASTSKLPLLDKAKLYVLATYAIESILFSALRLNGVDAKSHPVFQELNRVKEYFAKIKTAEGAGAKRSNVVDKEAAGRFIKHGLAGNDRYDRERAGAKRKQTDIPTGTHTRFDGAAKRMRTSESGVAVVKAADLDDDEDADAQKQLAERPRWTHAQATTRRFQLSDDGVEGEQADADADGYYAPIKRKKVRGKKGKGKPQGDEDGGTADEGGVRGDAISEWQSEAAASIAPKAPGEPLPEEAFKQRSGKKRGRKGRAEAQRDLEDKRAAEML